MTEGHKHRTIKTTAGSRLERVLRHQFLPTRDTDKVERSRFVYGPLRKCPAGGCTDQRCRDGAYALSLLGVLHGLFGLTLEVKEP